MHFYALHFKLLQFCVLVVPSPFPQIDDLEHSLGTVSTFLVQWLFIPRIGMSHQIIRSSGNDV